MIDGNITEAEASHILGKSPFESHGKIPAMWPTPTVYGNNNRHGITSKAGDGLATAAKMYPTPRASEWKGTGPLGSRSHKYRVDRQYLDATVQEMEQTTGRLNVEFVEWLMGYPIGLTGLKPVETDKFLLFLRQHGIS